MSQEITATQTVAETMPMEFIDLEGVSTPVEAEFSYDAADPFAVSILFKVEPAAVRWTFARDLLIDGFYQPTGDGDIHVWPCLSADGSAVVIVEFESPSGGAMVQITSRDMAAFIAQMLTLVPLETESDLLDFDAELSEILAA
ncbi:MAG: SsgA family sporulation/cell division regulator [Propionibacteriales bacterium]|nr:SsgA family sporulation/cell division regulator [Propionibacteriales bacterium]